MSTGCENGQIKHCLCDVFRQGRVARLSQRRGIDQVDMPFNECGKRPLGLAAANSRTNVMSSPVIYQYMDAELESGQYFLK
jgi:hypothetical protein